MIPMKHAIRRFFLKGTACIWRLGYAKDADDIGEVRKLVEDLFPIQEIRTSDREGWQRRILLIIGSSKDSSSSVSQEYGWRFFF
ncbi:MAG: hypothetical protein ACLU3F_02815 [Blautia wexlerae]